MKSVIPLVSIGIPCYNEGKYIRSTIESALNQTYGNIEIIVSDNSSSDDTIAIVTDYSIRYPDKISVLRNVVNIGALNNFKEVLNQARGDYFMWLGGHDIINPEIIQSGMDIYLKEKGVALVYHQHQFIDTNGFYIDTPELKDISSGNLNKVQSCLKVYRSLGYCTQIHGIFPTKIRENIPFYNGIGPDHLMLFAFSLYGKIVAIDKPYYLRRENRIETLDEANERYQQYGMKKSSSVFYGLYKQHVKFIFRNPIVSLYEKLYLLPLFVLSANKQHRDLFIKQFLLALLKGKILKL